MNLRDPDYFPNIESPVRQDRPLPARCGVSAVESMRCVSIVEATRCHGIFGSGDKVQSTVNTQVGASEQAEQIYGIGANISKAGAIALTGSNIRDLTITDGGAITTLADLLKSKETADANKSESQNSLLNGLITSFGSLVESKNTDGASSQNKTILYIALAIAAVFGIFFFRRAR